MFERVDVRFFRVSAMEPIVSRLDVTAIFYDVDDFCQQLEQAWANQPQLPSMPGEKRSGSRLRLSEVMTIVIAFHGKRYHCLWQSDFCSGSHPL